MCDVIKLSLPARDLLYIWPLSKLRIKVMRHFLKKMIFQRMLTETNSNMWSHIFRFLYPKHNPGASLIYKKKVPRVQLC